MLLLQLDTRADDEDPTITTALTLLANTERRLIENTSSTAPTTSAISSSSNGDVLLSLFSRHYGVALRSIIGTSWQSPSSLQWNKDSFARLVFFRLLKRGGIPCFASHIHQVLPILVALADVERDAAIRSR
jgi:hypothetical protein